MRRHHAGCPYSQLTIITPIDAAPVVVETHADAGASPAAASLACASAASASVARGLLGSTSLESSPGEASSDSTS